MTTQTGSRRWTSASTQSTGRRASRKPTKETHNYERLKSKPELEAELENANEYIEELETKLDSIAGIASGDEDEDEESGADDDDQD